MTDPKREQFEHQSPKRQQLEKLIGALDDDLVEQAASRLADAMPKIKDWWATGEEEREALRVGAKAVLTWLYERPEPH